MSDRHAEVKEQFDRITATWPARGDIDLPQFPDDPLAGVDFPDEIPDLDPVELTDYARRALEAAGEFQHTKPRGRRKRAGQSASACHPDSSSMAKMSLDDKRPCV